MNITIVGNVIKDVYLNLDTRTDALETDSKDIKWLNLSFNSSKHHFFNRNSSFGGAAVSLETLQKLGISTNISSSTLNFNDNQSPSALPSAYRYILIADNKVSYFTPSDFPKTPFDAPAEAVNYLYIDRSANLDQNAIKKITTYLELSSKTKLVLYLYNDSQNLTPLLTKADLVFVETNGNESAKSYAPELDSISGDKIIHLSKNRISYLDISEPITASRIDILTELSAFSIMSATILGSFALGLSVEDSLKLARANVENAKINSALSLDELKKIADTFNSDSELELIAASLMVKGKGILAADESGGSIKKKFEQLNIEDTYDNRRDYRNLFFSTPDIEQYLNGIILFDETSRQLADNGQSFVEYLTAKRIIPGIKVDEGLAPLNDTTETYTKGIDNLAARLRSYYQMGLRFAKWRAAFNVTLSDTGELLTPSDATITTNCELLARYAAACQEAGLVPIVEPEVIYDGNYPLEISALATTKVLDTLFTELKNRNVNLKACILKINMVLAGKQFETQSTPEIVGQATAEVLKKHVPADLAGIVFLSGGQTPEQATDNLAAVIKNGPYPWPISFSFARALQDPALYAWAGDNTNADAAKKAFFERLIANSNALVS